MIDAWDERPCHYVNVDGVRVLISKCWGTVHSDDLEDCYCYRPKRATLRDEVQHLITRNRELEAENKRLAERNAVLWRKVRDRRDAIERTPE